MPLYITNEKVVFTIEAEAGRKMSPIHNVCFLFAKENASYVEHNYVVLSLTRSDVIQAEE